MARKEAEKSHHGWADFIGVGLLAAAVLLFFAQVSFDHGDISGLTTSTNKPLHNWIGWAGAHVAWVFFLMFGLTAYFVPVLFLAFGLGYLFNFLGYLREHSRWSLFWASMLLVSLTGLLHIMHDSGLTGDMHVSRGATSAGGWLGFLTFEYGFWMAGKVGAVILYGTIALFGVLFLTNFKLGVWLQAWADRASEAKPITKPSTNSAEAALERKARELEKKKKDLEAEVAKTITTTSSPTVPGLGQDLRPVPEPTVRDLSYPQAKPARAKKAPEPTKEIEPAEEVEVIKAEEVKAATADDILGRKSEVSAKTDDKKSDEEKAEEVIAANAEAKLAEPKPEPVVNITGLTSSRPKPKAKKPITVASTPIIGNYQLPSMDFLQLPDMTLKPTESKEELLANARLMQQTLAQFDIQVELGDITKGPTITRYELHPAPGVKLEKIAALSNNIAAALKAERINILAPVPGKSSVGVEVPNSIKTKVIMRDLLESEEWINSKARIP